MGAIVQTPLGSLFRFGPFQVNSDSGELLKNGNRVKLQEQPFKVLQVLLERPGELVTREELQFVDGPLGVIAKASQVYSDKLRQGLALANLANAAQSVIGMLPV